jgi:hypothetical protein
VRDFTVFEKDLKALQCFVGCSVIVFFDGVWFGGKISSVNVSQCTVKFYDEDEEEISTIELCTQADILVTSVVKGTEEVGTSKRNVPPSGVASGAGDGSSKRRSLRR